MTKKQVVVLEVKLPISSILSLCRNAGMKIPQIKRKEFFAEVSTSAMKKVLAEDLVSVWEEVNEDNAYDIVDQLFTQEFINKYSEDDE